MASNPCVGGREDFVGGVPDVFLCLREFLWKFSSFWYNTLLYKLQKCVWTPSVRAASGQRAGTRIHWKLSRMPGDLDLINLIWRSDFDHLCRSVIISRASLPHINQALSGSVSEVMPLVTGGAGCHSRIFSPTTALWELSLADLYDPSQNFFLGIGNVCFAFTAPCFPWFLLYRCSAAIWMGIECNEYMNILL